jgi:outer membrane protein assembly factor BamB
LLLVFTLAEWGCPAPPKPRPRRPRQVEPPSYPYRGKTIRVDGRIHVISRSKTRALGVLYQPVKGGLVKPTGLVGLDFHRGTKRWIKPVRLQLQNPEVPWSFEIARNVTYLAVWTEQGTIKAFDIYGRDAWETEMKGLLGVSKLGVGFVTAKGSQIYFIERKSGKITPVADVGAPITAPLVTLPEGEVIALTGDFLVGVNLDAPKGERVLFRHRLETIEGLEPIKPQVITDTIIVGSQAVPLVIKTEVSRLDPKTLEPQWKKMIPGRVRSHHSVHADAREVRVINRVPGRPDHLYVLRPKDGQVLSKQPAPKRRNCYYGSKLVYCVTAKAVTAYERRSLRKAWSREMLDDVTGHKHLAHGGRFFIAEGTKVVGVAPTGRVSFTFEIKAPPFRPRVNRILGVVDGVLVFTVADWITGKGTGQIWGVDLKTGKRRWSKKLVKPAYSEKAVALVGDRVLYADTTYVNAVRAASGRLAGRWPHLFRAPATKIPEIHQDRGQAWLERAGRLGLLNTKTGRLRWKRPFPGPSKVVAAGQQSLFVKTPTGEIEALSLKNGKPRWKVSFPPTVTPKIVEVEGGVIFSHPQHAFVVDPQTGKRTKEWKPGGWQLTMLGDSPLLVRVVTFEPKHAGLLEAVRYFREEKKTERSWALKIPLPKKKVEPLSLSVKKPFPWFQAASDLVLYPRQGGRCITALDLMEGKPRWENCDLPWIAPPRAYRGVLYHATGPYREDLPAERQGLLSVSTGAGKVDQIFKIPRQGAERLMRPQYGPIVDGEYFALTQGYKLRHLMLAAPMKKR